MNFKASTPTPVKIHVNRTGDKVKFELATGKIDVGHGVTISSFSSFYETADRDFLRQVRDLINDALTYPPESDSTP